MVYIFTGFQQANAIRQFAFDCVADDKTCTKITVGADLALARKHFILMQDLPLLCRRLLETSEEIRQAGPMMFSEDQMLAVETAKVNAKAEKKPARTPVASNRLGQAWRSPDRPTLPCSDQASAHPAK